jgi:uncharacterized protein (DUF305 family)
MNEVSTTDRPAAEPTTERPTDDDLDAEAEAGGAGPDDPEADDPEDWGGGGAGLSWSRVAVLGLALAFLGFAVGIFVSRDTPPGEGSTDVGFAQDMLTHHQQALVVAAAEVANGENATVRSYAREVLTFQSYEIGVMQQRLRDWGYDPAERPAEAMGWMGMPVPWEDMVGLLSDEQIDEMSGARGGEADALFLELMAEHHRGGLHMAEYASENVDDADLRDLAGRMARNQAQEINEYRGTAEREGFDVDIEPSEVPPPLPD